MTGKRPQPVEIAHALFTERYSGARVIFFAGSVVRGEGTPGSDLDLVVVYDQLPLAYRESYIYRAWPVEAFVHDPETMHYFFVEFDGRACRPVLQRMVSEGIEIPEPSDFSKKLKSLARASIDQGPAPWDDKEKFGKRYLITDLVEDLRHARSEEEMVALGTTLYQALGDYYFRSHRLWTAQGKYIPRRLAQADPDFAARFSRAFESLFTKKDSHDVVKLAEDTLQPDGGFAFDGYRQDAPPEWRKPL